MHYKAKVLERFHDARVVVVERFPDGEPKYCAVFVSVANFETDCADEEQTVRLDIHDPDGRDRYWGGAKQLAGAAWRSAYYWGVRNPERVREAA